MLASLKSCRYPAEIGLLLGLCFFLPLFEAPKNLLWVAYALAWVVNRVRSGDWGGRWDLWDTLIAAWIASGFVVAAFAGLDGQQWRGAGDLVRYGSLLWLVKRAGYEPRVLRWVLGSLVASTVIGLAIGYARMLSGIGKSGTLQLHSVGHVNHTAIYIAIMLGVCASWLFARWQAWHTGKKAVGLAVGTLVLVSLVVTASRGAIGVGLATLPILAGAWWPRWRAPAVASGVVLAAVVILAVFSGAEVVQKQEQNLATQNPLSHRDGVWRMAFAAWQRHPWFGIGMDNYSQVTLERVKAWRAEAGRPFDERRYFVSSHAHSLYVNTLAERGIIGTAILVAVLLAWAAWLVRYRPGQGSADDEWLLWGAAASAWIVTAGAGLANTTLHHEHGILAALLLGLWLSRLRAHRAS
ncbi:MAG: O-antigen ligase family protein [Betaproteobacteria bacterium]|nr:MAG: O-antigen ligase family protein [Betaproteobacteria bacterium]